MNPRFLFFIFILSLIILGIGYLVIRYSDDIGRMFKRKENKFHNKWKQKLKRCK